MHTQERQLTRFLYFTTDLQRKPNRCFFQNVTETEPNPRFFLKTETEPNLKNPFRTSLFEAKAMIFGPRAVLEVEDSP